MKRLIVYVVALSLIFNLLAAKRVESNTDMIPYYMFNSASAFNLDIALLYAVCTVESRCRAKAINKDDASPKNKALGKKEHSLGLFQIKLATARMLGFKGTSKELMQPEVNTWYAAKLLRRHLDKYGTIIKALSAYNAGRYTRANQDYVAKVLVEYAHYKIDRHI